MREISGNLGGNSFQPYSINGNSGKRYTHDENGKIVVVSDKDNLNTDKMTGNLGIQEDIPNPFAVEEDIPNPFAEEQEKPKASQEEPVAHKNFIDRLFNKAVEENRDNITLGKAELSEVKAAATQNGGRVDAKAFKAAEKARAEAEKAMSELDKLTGRDLAAAFNDPKMPFEKSAAGKAFLKAMNAQLALAEKLDDCVMKSDHGSGFEELSMRANLRAAELTRLIGELGDAFAKGEQNERLEKAGLSSDLARIATEAHGTREAVAFLENTYAEPLKQLEIFTAPEKDLTQDQVVAFKAQVGQMKQVIAEARQHGIDFRGDGLGRTMVDPSVFASIEKILTNLHSRLENHQKKFVSAALKKFTESVAVPATLLQMYKTMTPEQKNRAPALGRFINLFAKVREELNGITDDVLEGRIETEQASMKIQLVVGDYLSMKYHGEIGTHYVALQTELRMLGLDPEMVRDSNGNLIGASYQQMETELRMLPELTEQLEQALVHWQDGTASLNSRTTDILALLDGDVKINDHIEARVHGFGDELVDTEVSGLEPISYKPIGAGASSTAYLCTFQLPNGTTTQRVFKAESSAIFGMKHGVASFVTTDGTLTFQKTVGYDAASQNLAKMMGVGARLMGAKIGHLNGQFGMFLEVAPGKEPEKVVNSGNLGDDNCTTAELQKLQKTNPQKYYEVRGETAKQLNQLHWLDMLSGQLDRHDGNYHISISKDFNTVRVTGIDNDASFSDQITELGKCDCKKDFMLRRFLQCRLGNADDFQRWIEELTARGACVQKGTTGEYTFEFAKMTSDQRLSFLLTSGLKSIKVPSVMDASIYNKIVHYTKDEAGAAEYLKSLEGYNLTKAQKDAALARLKSARKIADQMKMDGLVLEDDDWKNSDPKSQKFSLKAAPLDESVENDRSVNGYYEDLQMLSTDYFSRPRVRKVFEGAVNEPKVFVPVS